MGVFSKKSKVRDQDVHGGLERTDVAPPKPSLTFRRKQKNTEAAKFEFDLDSALPDTNEFRTSMLMPKLSARFSMLREQDDPETKVGKASDDSVLFPKRASRLNLFSHNPLADIAEQPATFRPPFADSGRSFSLSEGYNSEDGGYIMARPRHVDGNTLFGGRQKIYKIATASDSDRANGRGSEKHTYRDDVVSSVLGGSDGHLDHDAPRLSHEEPHEPVRANSRSTALSHETGITSSIASIPSYHRTSTAATSITSDSPVLRQSNASSSKVGAPDNLNSADDPPVRREPPLPNPLLLTRAVSSSKSAINLNESYFRQNSNSALAPSASPPPAMSQKLASFEFALQDPTKSNSQRRRYQTASPTNDLDGEDASHIYSSAVQPKDRGKATAMGLFNRPAQQFDEQQFMERQRQMHKDRASPPRKDPQREAQSRKEQAPPSTKTATDTPPNVPVNGFAVTTTTATTTPSSQHASKPATVTTTPVISSSLSKKIETLNALAKSENPGPRPRRKSNAQADTQADKKPDTASASSNPLPPDMKARVESLIRRKNAELAAMEAEQAQIQTQAQPRNQHSSASNHSNPSRPRSAVNGVDGVTDDTLSSSRTGSKSPHPPTDIHPAFRDSTNDSEVGESVAGMPRVLLSRQSQSSNLSTPHSEHVPSIPMPSGSPTAATGPGLGLSGLVSKHLRHDSDRSSAHISSSPTAPTFNRSEVNHPDSVHSDPWEFDRGSQGRPDRHSNHARQSEQPSPSSSAKIHPFFELDEASSNSRQVSARQDGLVSSKSSTSDEMSHKRAESTETQRERREFDDDLAERQRKIQERLKAISDHPPRSKSQIRQALPQAIQGLMPKATKGSAVSASDDSPSSEKTTKTQSSGRPSDDSPSSEKTTKPQSSGRPSDDSPSSEKTTKPQSSGRPSEERDRQHNGHVPGDLHQQQQRGSAEQVGRYDERSNDVNHGQNDGRRTPGGRTTPHGQISYEEFGRRRQQQRSATPASSRAPSAGRHRTNSTTVSRSRSRQAGVYQEEENFSTQPTSRNSPTHARSNGVIADDARAPSRTGYKEDIRSPSAMGNHSHNGGMRSSSRPRQASEYHDSRIPPSIPQQGPQMSSSARASSPFGGRKRLVSKGMVSIPALQDGESPPIPPYNPERRRAHATTGPTPAGQGWRNFSRSGVDAQARHDDIQTHGRTLHTNAYYDGNPQQQQQQQQQQPMIYGSSHDAEGVYNSSSPESYTTRKRNQLRKINSEGGNLSGRARQQAFHDELNAQNSHSPALPVAYSSHAGADAALKVDANGAVFGPPPPRLRPQVFPNRSDTNLGIRMPNQLPKHGMF